MIDLVTLLIPITQDNNPDSGTLMNDEIFGVNALKMFPYPLPFEDVLLRLLIVAHSTLLPFWKVMQARYHTSWHYGPDPPVHELLWLRLFGEGARYE